MLARDLHARSIALHHSPLTMHHLFIRLHIISYHMISDHIVAAGT